MLAKRPLTCVSCAHGVRIPRIIAGRSDMTCGLTGGSAYEERAGECGPSGVNWAPKGTPLNTPILSELPVALM